MKLECRCGDKYRRVTIMQWRKECEKRGVESKVLSRFSGPFMY